MSCKSKLLNNIHGICYMYTKTRVIYTEPREVLEPDIVPFYERTYDKPKGTHNC